MIVSISICFYEVNVCSHLRKRQSDNSKKMVIRWKTCVNL